MAEQDEKPIRVVDRRMFTPEGELRPDFEPEEPREAPRAAPAPDASAAAEVPSSAGPEAPVQGEGEAPEPRTAFGSLVGWIATNAYSALGLLPDPAAAAHKDLRAARQMIDWLAVLEQKTRGNLSFEESDFLSRALYELRLAFVEVSRRSPK